eukprot:g4608.t1
MKIYQISVLLVILVYGILDADAQSRVFTSCSVGNIGFGVTSSRSRSADIAAVCRSTSPAGSGPSRRSPAPGAPDSGFDVETTTITTTTTTGGGGGSATATARAVASSGASSSEVAISASSTGGVPFRVTSGATTTDVTTAQSELVTRINEQRPRGIWLTIVSVDVRQRPSTVWPRIRNLGSFLTLGLQGLGARVQARGGNSYRVTLASGEGFTVTSENREDGARYQTIILSSISRNVFPGFDYDGTRWYYQVSSDVFEMGGSNIELGWGIQIGRTLSGNLEVGIRLIEAFLLEILENLEDQFGQICEFGRNIRTIEGDCNNLQNPPQGSAGEALRRLGRGDPAYPQNNRNRPSGPVEISPREISNKLFAMSPGAEILRQQSDSLTECIDGITPSGGAITLCPLESVTLSGLYGDTVVPFDEIRTNEDEELVFVYSSRRCTIRAVFKCCGESSIDFAADPCGADTNRFFDPLACTTRPGADSVLANPEGLTDMFFTFGQFIDHDVGLTPTSQLARNQPGFSRNSRASNLDELPIEIPEDDFHFPNQDEFEFERARFSEDDRDSHVNQHSSYLDGSQIYGVDFLRARLLRSFVGGRLDLSAGNLPPFNGFGGDGSLGAVVDNAPNTDPRFFVVGDVRGNEQPLLLALHICFLREHNLVADELADLFPNLDDEALYQTARAIVIAEYQSIVYNEWLPLLLGFSSPSSDQFSYNSGLDATVSAIFTTAAFRFGHSMVGTNLLRMGRGSRSFATMNLVPIRDVFFEPQLVSGSGLDEFLRGGAWHAAKELDHIVVDELRNFLITGEGRSGSDSLFDLVSLNIQRSRDMGVPTFNDVRRLFGLRPYYSFSDFIVDENLADLAAEVYEGDVENVDAFFGGLVEPHLPGAQLGETFHTIISDQFRRLRDGDRFFYSGLTFDSALVARMPRINAIIQNRVTLGDIIARNSGVTTSELGFKPSVFQL